MTQKPIVSQTGESSRKCFHCGLRNFAVNTRCARCKYDVWLPLNEQVSDHSREFSRLKVGVLIAAVLLSGLVLFYIRQDSQGTPGAVSEGSVTHPATQQEEQPEVIAEENPQSREAAKHVLAGLKRFQGATASNLSYEQYDEMLTRLKVYLNNTLPSFVDHNPGDETFRLDVDGAIRDYTAAGNWWKTAMRNSSVFTDADRTERLNVSWASAKTHLDNAEQMLGR